MQRREWAATLAGQFGFLPRITIWWGLRPTKGLSSIAGIVPLSVTQDVGGPLARTVSDLAVMLDATIGEDPNDTATHLAAGRVRPNFTQALKADSMVGARIGILEPLFGGPGDDQDMGRVVRAALEEMKKAGAIIIFSACTGAERATGRNLSYRRGIQ